MAELKLLQGMQEQLYEQTRDLDARADVEEAERRSRLRDLGDQQRELLDIGRDLLEEMNQQQGGAPAIAAPGAPAMTSATSHRPRSERIVTGTALALLFTWTSARAPGGPPARD